ncbi:hypothetical protein MEO40_17725 [Dolichospermum sp. ST_sed1]|nr:hypothetical protein [Dolichospermum sp. ST_sed1]
MENSKYFDLYGFENTVLILAEKFKFVSWCKNSIPTAGSLTKDSKKLNLKSCSEVKKVINHKNGEVTIQTELGYLKFTN